MPKIGKKHYAYTKEGKAEYKKDKKRLGMQEGGSSLDNQMASLIPDESMVEEMPEEQMLEEQEFMGEQEEEMLPDETMEGDYVDFIIEQSLTPEDEQYLLDRLSGDDRLSSIFDSVVETASEFSGAGLVEGPGTPVSDSIPARLSDGEFVMTSKAANEIGPDNLQGMMEQAEFEADDRERRIMQAGGLAVDEEKEKGIEDQEISSSIKPTKKLIPESMVNREVKKAMLSQNPRYSLFSR